MTRTTDVIVVGGGIMGLAFAWEAAVLAEFATRAPDLGVPCELLPGAEAVRRFPSLAPDARAVLWSPTEVVVDPPRAIAAVAAHLQRMHGVDIHFSTTVVGVQMPRVITSRGERFEAPLVIVCDEAGEVILGDSHDYESPLDPFDAAEIEDSIVTYARRMLRLPDWSIAARWHGVYTKGPRSPNFTAEPQPGCHVMGSPGGAGMTLAFGLAERWWTTQGG